MSESVIGFLGRLKNKALNARTRIRKGFTLVELSIAMSISVLITGGLTAILIFTARSISATQAASNALSNAKTLALAIDNAIDQNNGNFVYTVDFYENNSSFKEVSSSDLKEDKVLFSVLNIDGEIDNYVFCHQHFGFFREGDTEYKFTNVYTSNSQIKMKVFMDSELDTESPRIFQINYGENYSQILNLFKDLQGICNEN